jgi:ABC-type bacteriocin/lantibiotic exporter with double-glycine peptidase domain
MADAPDHHDVHLPPLQRLFRLLAPERKDLRVVVLYAIGVGLLNLVAPLITTAVLNTVVLGTLLQQLVVLCLAMLLGLLLAALLQGMQAVVVEFMQRRIFVRVAADLAFRLPKVEMRAFDKQHGPELVNRFFDVLTVQKAGATLLLDGVALFLQTLIGMVLLAVYDSVLLGFDLILLGCLTILFFVLGRGAVRTAIQESIAKYQVAGWLEEIARHPIAFKLAGGPALAAAKTDRLTQNYLDHRQAHFRRLFGQIAFSLILQAAANVSLLAIGGWLVIQERLSPGQLVAAQLVVALVVASFAKFGKQLESYYDLLAAVDKLGHLIDLPLERDRGDPATPAAGGMAIAVHDLSFRYDDGPSVLNHLNLQVKPGEKVALRGPNGAGKSTFIDLLYGIREATEGRIEFDGRDLRDLTYESARAGIAVVKDIECFEGTIADNVAMGRAGIDLAAVRAALDAVGLSERILRFREGLNTPIWTGGRPLSQGQANRLMIARALAGGPRLIVLDETLDHMDEAIRDLVIPTLLGKDRPWTVLVVTHSDDIARRCDRVVRF